MSTAADQATVEDLREALRLADESHNRMLLQLQSLTSATMRLCTDVAVMCEAYLANDNALVLHKLGELAANYQRHLKPNGRSVH